ELINEVAISGVHFDTVESRRHRVLCGFGVLLHNTGNLLAAESPRRRNGLKAFCVKARAFGLMAEGATRQGPSWLKRWVGNASHVPELQEHRSGGDAHSLRHDSPAFDLLGAVNAWR